MAKTILKALEKAEQKWRSTSGEWKRKVAEWEAWKSRAKERTRLADRQKKRPGDDDLEASSTQDYSWESSFDPDQQSPQFSFATTGVTYSSDDLANDLSKLSWQPIPSWAVQALKRGVAVHHSGMNKRYRSLVER